MRLQAIEAFLLVLSAAVIAFGQSPVSNPPQQTPKVETVEYCELMANPEYFFGKVKRVEAVLTNLISNEGILWAECGTEKHSISVGFADDKLDELSERILARMHSWRVDEAKVIVVGKLYGPRSPDSKFNYGHMGWSKYLFEITSLEEIERMKKQKNP